MSCYGLLKNSGSLMVLQSENICVRSPTDVTIRLCYRNLKRNILMRSPVTWLHLAPIPAVPFTRPPPTFGPLLAVVGHVAWFPSGSLVLQGAIMLSGYFSGSSAPVSHFDTLQQITFKILRVFKFDLPQNRKRWHYCRWFHDVYLLARSSSG